MSQGFTLLYDYKNYLTMRLSRFIYRLRPLGMLSFAAAQLHFILLSSVSEERTKGELKRERERWREQTADNDTFQKPFHFYVFTVNTYSFSSACSFCPLCNGTTFCCQVSTMPARGTSAAAVLEGGKRQCKQLAMMRVSNG